MLLLCLAIALALLMGIYPKPFTDVMDTSVADLPKHVAVSNRRALRRLQMIFLDRCFSGDPASGDSFGHCFVSG
jgi:hypothetical protein